jgi:hypothetical protein
MAYELGVQNSSIIASADLSSYQYYCVKINSSGLCALCGDGENAIGILQNKPVSGDVCDVMVLGESKAIYGGSVTAGSNLASDSNGRLVVASGSDAIIGVAKESGSVNEIHTVYLVTRTSSGVNSSLWGSFTGTLSDQTDLQSALDDKVGNSIISIPVKLANVTTGDVVTSYTPGFAGTILKISAVVITVTTDVDADLTFNLEIGSTNLTGGVVTLDDSITTLGEVIDGTSITGGNVFTNTDTISIEANVTNAFSDGEVVLLIVIGN